VLRGKLCRSLQLVGFTAGGKIYLLRYVVLDFMFAERKVFRAMSSGISYSKEWQLIQMVIGCLLSVINYYSVSFPNLSGRLQALPTIMNVNNIGPDVVGDGSRSFLTLVPDSL